MGASKGLLAEQTTAVYQICQQAGLLSECESCSDLIYGGEDPQEAYKLANALFTQKAPLVASFASRTDLTDAIKEAIPNFNEECHCKSVYQNDPS